MPRTSSQRFQRSRSGSRPNRSWDATQTAAFVNIPAASKVLLAAFTISIDLDITLLRSVGILSVISDQTAAAEQQIGAFGMCLATDVAITAGVASIPGPITEANEDVWFTYVPFAQRNHVLTAVGTIKSELYAFDSKAKRVINSGTGIALVIENAHATHAFDVAVVMRLLTQIRGTG